MRALLLTLLFCAAAPAVDAGERRALLVGVSHYPDAPGLPPLAGPPNDVALMAEALDGLWDGIEITRLAGDGPARPTRAAILGALGELARRSGPGDLAVVYLAGHGTQLASETERDGFDEVFLPADFRLVRDRGAVTIANHIRDDEFGTAFAAILETGASIWLIADLCHAGTIERSARRGAVRARFAPLALGPGEVLRDLGSPPTAAASDDPAPTLADGVPRGRFVGFYAAGPGAQSLEMPLGGRGGAAGVHGVFTFELARQMRAGGAARFRDLADAIARAYWGWGQGLPVPMFAGALDLPLAARRMPGGFALERTDDGLGVGAGLLDGVAAGDLFAISDPATPEAPPLVHARVRAAGLTRSTLGLLADAPGHPDRIDAAIAAEGLDPAAWRERWLAARLPGMVARRQGPPGVAPFDVALPAPAPPQLDRMLDAALPRAIAPLPLRRVAADAPADLRLVPGPEGLTFLPGRAAPGPVPSPFILSHDRLDPDTVARALGQIARAHWLVQLLPGLAASPLTQAVETRIAVAPCAEGAPVRVRLLRPGMPRPAIHDCDTVILDFANRGSRALDLSPLYVGPHGRIYYLDGYPGGAFHGLRLEAGGKATVRYRESLSDDLPAGDVYVVVLAVPADPGRPVATDFRRLAGDLPVTVLRAEIPLVPGPGQGGAIVIPLRTERDAP